MLRVYVGNLMSGSRFTEAANDKLNYSALLKFVEERQSYLPTTTDTAPQIRKVNLFFGLNVVK